MDSLAPRLSIKTPDTRDSATEAEISYVCPQVIIAPPNEFNFTTAERANLKLVSTPNQEQRTNAREPARTALPVLTSENVARQFKPPHSRVQ